MLSAGLEPVRQIYVLPDLSAEENIKIPVVFQKEAWHCSCWKPKGRLPMKEEPDAQIIGRFLNVSAEELP
jgi:hypothetical protein